MSVAEKMTELADAVRDLIGTTELMTLDEMIRNIRDMAGVGIIGNAEGHIIQISDCVTRKLHGLSLYGKTVQNGIPSPVSPVEPVNLGGNGSVTVHVDDQTLIISTPNGLPGVPVAQNGNYTDANGQQWVCDEIDFAAGKYIQRVKTFVFDGSSDEGWTLNGPTGAGMYRVMSHNKLGIKSVATSDIKADVLCSHFEVTTGGLTWWSTTLNGFAVDANGYLIAIRSSWTSGDTTLAEWTSDLSRNPMKIVAILDEPIETSLRAEELSAYSNLHTNYPHTTIYNDADAWMTVKYAADTATVADYIAALQELGVEV